jgi:hypothetical protein
MADQPQARGPDKGLRADELAAEQSVSLPERDALSTISIDIGADIENLTMPINQALSLNVNSNYSVANSDADQVVIADQSVDQTPPAEEQPWPKSHPNKG